MVKGKRLGLVGKVILGAGAVGGLVGGCNAVVGGYIGGKVAEKTAAKREVLNTEEMRGPEVPYDVNFLAYYRIQDLGTGEVEIVEGRYGFMSKDFFDKYEKSWDEKYSNGFKAEFIEEGRLTTIIGPTK